MAPRAARGSAGLWKGPACSEARQNSPVASCCLDGTTAKTMTGDSGHSEEALERRLQQTHYVRPCGRPGAMGLWLQVLLLGFMRLGQRGTEGCHRGR